jgi:hypothetical protein
MVAGNGGALLAKAFLAASSLRRRSDAANGRDGIRPTPGAETFEDVTADLPRFIDGVYNTRRSVLRR